MNGGAYGLARAVTTRPLSPAVVLRQPPGDRLVAVEPAERREVLLDLRQHQRHADVTLEHHVEAPGIALGDAVEPDERRDGQRPIAAALTVLLPLLVLGLGHGERQQRSRIASAAS